MFCGTFRFGFVLTRSQIPAEFAPDAVAIFDAFELEGHTKRVRDLASDLLKRMPEDTLVKKRVLRRELDTTDSPTPSVELSVVSESDYESVLEFRRDVVSVPDVADI